jgi:hypothetical protein
MSGYIYSLTRKENGTASELIEKKSFSMEEWTAVEQTAPAVSNTFVDQIETFNENEVVSAKSFSLETDPMFYDHVVLGLPRLQAVSYLELIYVTATLNSSFSLNNIQKVQLHYPISVLENASNISRTRVKRSPGGDYDIEIFSDIYGKSFLNARAYGQKVDLVESRIDPEKIKKEFSRQEEIDFAQISDQENNFIGPYFYAFEEIWREENRIFARLGLSQKARASNHNFLLHPGLLDPCVYLAMGITHESLKNKGISVYLPIYFEDVRIHGYVNDTIYCLIEPQTSTIEDNKVLRFNIYTYDLDGKLLLEILGMDLKKVPVDKTNETEKILSEMGFDDQHKMSKSEIVRKW